MLTARQKKTNNSTNKFKGIELHYDVCTTQCPTHSLFSWASTNSKTYIRLFSVRTSGAHQMYRWSFQLSCPSNKNCQQNKKFLFEFDCNFPSIEFNAIEKNQIQHFKMVLRWTQHYDWFSYTDTVCWNCVAFSTMVCKQNTQQPQNFIWLRKDEILHNFSIYLFKKSGFFHIHIDYTKQMIV